jgi:CubicO group peptidase (beta-lactamase class C family)
MVMARSVIRGLGVVQFLLVVAACGGEPTIPNSDFDWPRGSATDAGLDTARLGALVRHVEDSLPNVNALVIVRGGTLVWEWYHPASDTNEAYDTHSITKSAIATFVGQALHTGQLTSLDQLVGDVFTEVRHDDEVDPRFREATIRHLLAMQSGLENEITQRVPFTSTDLVNKLLRLPLLYAPGEGWHYDMANSHILSGLLQRRVGESVGAWAQRDLFARFNITAGRWQSDHEGVSLGWTGLHLNARDLAKLGELYLRDGVWLGERLFPAGYAALVAGTVTTPRDDYFADYALHWWTTMRWGTPAWIAAGFRHQYLVILPAHDAVIVMQSASSQLRAPLRDHFPLFGDYLVPAF